MLENRFDRLARIKAVEREHGAMRFAADRLLRLVQHDPTILEAIGHRDLMNAAGQLEGTYVVRLFAEFETCLRSYWRTCVRDTNPPAELLVDRIGDKRRIPRLQVLNAQKVRQWRNTLVHERDEAVERVSIAAAKGHLCHYVAFLPLEW